MNQKSITRNMLFNTVGSIIYYFSVWLITIFLVKFSGFEETGIFSLATSITAAPAIIGLFNIRSFQVSDLKDVYTDKTYIDSRKVTNVISFVICFILVLVGRYTLDKAFVILAFMLFKMTEGTADVYYGIEQKNGRLDYTGISLFIRGIGSIGSFCIIYLFFKSLLIGILAMTIFSIVIVYLYDQKKVKMLGVKIYDKGNFRKVKELLCVCLPLAMVAFFNNLSIIIPRIFLEKFFGSEVMGIYFSIASPTQVVQLAATTLFAPLIPLLTDKFNSGCLTDFGTILKRFFSVALILSIICLVFSGFFAKPVLGFMFGTEIITYVNLFIPVIVSSILIGVNACMMSICTLMRKIKIQYVVGIVGMVSSAILSVFVVKEYSIKGVIIATMITMLIQIIIQIYLVLSGIIKNNVTAGEK